MNRPSAAHPPHPGASARRFAPLLALVLLVAGTLLYLPTFRSSFAYDDMDHLNLIGDALAGKAGFWTTVFTPHLEHLLPLVDMVFYAAVSLFGVKALPLRLLVFLVHIAAAWFMGLVAKRYGGSATAGFAAGLAYVLPTGFSSMWIWLLNGAGVPLFLFGLTGAVAAVAYRDRLGPLRSGLLAGAGVLIAAASESTLVPLLLFPALLAELERRQGGGPAAPRRLPGAFAAFCLLVMAGTTALATVLFHRIYHGSFNLELRHGILRGLFLLLVAPFRFLCPGVPLARPSDPGYTTPVSGSLLGIVFAAACAALLVALWRNAPRRLIWVAALAGVGPILEIFLVGLGRANTTFPDIYEADRYFFTLLLPICLLIGALAEGLRQVIAPWPAGRRKVLLACLAISLTAECWLHRQALLNRIPFEIFDRHERRIAQLARLDDDLAQAARRLAPAEPPLTLPDTNLWFPEVHNGRVSTRLLLHGIRHGIPGVQLGGPAVSARDERLLNPVLARWAEEIGEPTPYLSIVHGRLVNARMTSLIDFRQDPQSLAVVNGFYDWEGSSRWMGERGELRIQLSCPQLSFVLTAPVSLVRKLFPERPAIEVRVTALDEESGRAASLGSLSVGGDGIETYPLDATPLLRYVGAGRLTRLILEASPVWQPRAVLAGSLDPRLLTVRVFAVGCGAHS
ncbi:MAG TPA: hypothetical protein VHR45_12865 [Thermoanaerobaculia bacterium]|nr:hypothetical protein [Thermoanaerobaculia bacterium]